MLIEAENLTKRYRQVVALDGCSLGCQSGEVLGLLGPNGSGKTTLLRVLLGYLRPTAGTAQIAGHHCTSDALTIRRSTSYLPGEPRLPRRMRGRNVLSYFARLRGRSAGKKRTQFTQQLESRGNAIAERLALDTSRRVSNMSTGMRQKLALAIAFAPDVPLIILDEPTSNLDPGVRDEVGKLVAEARDAGKAVLFSSHVLPEVEAVCDRVVILRRGKLVHTQVMGELHTQHRIRGKLQGELTPTPPALADDLSIDRQENHVCIDTAGELSPLLRWLSEQPLAEVTIEPLGLRRVYERYHQAL